MKKSKFIYSALALMVSAFGLSSCNDFLDKMPDNRATLDSETKITNLLVSAYPQHNYALVTEAMSDNFDNLGESNPYTSRFIDQVWHWEDVTESDNESPESFYEDSYQAIAAANAALEAIDELGGATTTTLQEARAEALLCRAYNHFMLTNIFCMAYNDSSSTTDLGMPYIEAPETKVGVDYDRGTVAEDYEKIDRDIQEALPLVGESYYTVPKYHFNKSAAYAFATRFYLYYNQWEKAVQYANLCLGTDPSSSLRDYATMASMTQTNDALSQHYISADLPANLLLMTSYSNLGLMYGDYRFWSKYAHVPYIATNEDGNATNIWGSRNLVRDRLRIYSATNLSKAVYWRVPYMFEYTDPVAGIGYRHTVLPAFTTDEVLLNRAEAYILLKQYDKAAADLTTWMQNYTTSTMVLTPENISSFYNSQEYCYDDDEGLASALKKHLNPVFDIDAEGSTQENMLQCVLGFKRMETLELGLRWFDIKRYRIVIPRRTLNASGVPELKTDELTTNDPRRAIQLPTKVISAGMEPNPRN